eukprot:m51a1_g7492 hypothetical protein (500) ;mRNA; r:251831-254379
MGEPDLDSLMSQLGIMAGSARCSSGPPAVDDVDALINQLGINLQPAPGAEPTHPAPSAGGVALPGATAAASVAAGRGRAAGRAGPFSSGPGAAGRSGPFSSGPGAAGRSGPFCCGPGAAGRAGPFSSGPGAAGRAGPYSCGPGGRGAAPAGSVEPASFAPDGQKLTFSGPPCCNCSKMIIGKIISASGKQYHPECFVCHHCKMRIVEGAPFVEEGDQIYCEEHYLELFGEKCFACQRPIEDKCVRFLDRLYHPNHFCCKMCGSCLKEFKEDEGEPYCTTCKAVRVKQRALKNELCARCKLPITGDYIVVNGQKMHPEHYRCEICGAEFLGGNCKEWENKNYCLECFEKLIKTVCAGCNKPIVGRSINAMLRLWHPECLTCTICKEILTSTTFYEAEGKPYCNYHYIKLFGAVCARCNQKCEGDSIEALGKRWHPACWICNGCNKPLAGRVYDFESKPLCKSCFGHLPKEIQKEIKLREKADKKKLKEDDKEAKKAQKQK